MFLPAARLRGDRLGLLSAERVSKGFGELFRNGFANHCESTEYVFIADFLEWNPIANPNIAQASLCRIAGSPVVILLSR